MKRTEIERIIHFIPCDIAIEWLQSLDDNETLETAWLKCQRGDWMLWLIAKTCGPINTPGHRKMILAKSRCLRLVLPLFESQFPNNLGPRRAIEAIEAYAAGDDYNFTTTIDARCATRAAATRTAIVASVFDALAAARAAAYVAYNAARDVFVFSAANVVYDAACTIAYIDIATTSDVLAQVLGASATAARMRRRRRRHQIAALVRFADEVRTIFPTLPTLI